MKPGATVMARHWSIKGTVGSWQAGAENYPADVQTVREMLTIVSRKLSNAIIFNPFGITGWIEKPPLQSQTVRAINAFQKEIFEMARPDGLVEPNGATFKGLLNVADSELTKLYMPAGVDTKLRHGIVRLIACVGSAVVTSGKRTVEEQADAMLKMNSQKLQMYCPKGVTPGYVTQLRELIKNGKYTKDNVIRVLQDALDGKGPDRAKHFISHHLHGDAVDISDHQLAFRRQPALVLQTKFGVEMFNCTEEIAMHCCHFQVPHHKSG
jgi:hypothetical protein